MSQRNGRRGWVRRSIDDTGRTADRPEESAPDAGVRTDPLEPLLGFGTFIDQGVEFEGTLRIRGSFRIDTEYRGEIVCEDKVIIGESAGIEADIRAREVVILGAVVGNVSASRQLTIRASGRLHGDVEAPCLEIEKGAVFNGRMVMVRPEVAARATAGESAVDVSAPTAAAPRSAGSGASGVLAPHGGAAPSA